MSLAMHLAVFIVFFVGNIHPAVSGQQVTKDQVRISNKTCHHQLPGPAHIIRYSDNNCSALVLRCYCITSTSTNNNLSEVQYALGHCFEGCFITDPYNEYHNVSLTGSFEEANYICSCYNRIGRMCGKCTNGYGPAAYSFSLKCVECNGPFWKQLLYYILIAYGPLTVFLAIIVVFTISANSAPLHGWIFVSQIMASSFYMRTLTRTAELGHIDQYSYRLLGCLYGIWNLDFFRVLYKPFCLHSSLSTLQVISLDFFIAAYPLLIIVMLYGMVELYSHGCRLMDFICRPFLYCCIYFRHSLDIRTSLIDAFGTFFSLSFVKLFSTVVDVLAPSKVWEFNGVSYYPYFDGETKFFSNKHLPLVILSLILLLIFNVLPLILLLLYSSPKTQFCIHLLPQQLQSIVFPFMDNILSCYKDGRCGTPNCRYFAIVYQITRMCIWSTFLWTESAFFYAVVGVLLIITGLLVSLIRPYKEAAYNFQDTFFVLTLAIGFVGNTALFITTVDDPRNKPFGAGLIFIPICVHLFYILFYLGYKVWSLRHRLLSCIKWDLSKLLLSCIHQIHQKIWERNVREEEISEVSRLIQ